uniref:Uncharacterized protein n=1 Tax=Meloidogyne enterolobii TaxID=390850 RepID=A0A6V7XB47_MELEN|nr:unnamed protein product [Meloidogyne enterolobii]
MCSIVNKIIFATVLLMVICEFDVVSCGGNRGRRVNPPSIDQLRQELQNLAARFNEFRHGNPTINELQEMAQEFRNLENQFSTHPRITEAARGQHRRSIAQLEKWIADNIIDQINLQFGHIIGKLQNEHFGGTPHEYQDLV